MPLDSNTPLIHLLYLISSIPPSPSSVPTFLFVYPIQPFHQFHPFHPFLYLLCPVKWSEIEFELPSIIEFEVEAKFYGEIRFLLFALLKKIHLDPILPNEESTLNQIELGCRQ